MTEVIIPYSPRPYQAEIHKSLKRFNVLVLHRRAGKTVLAINELIKTIVTCPLPRAQGAYLAPLYGQAKRVAWLMIREYAGAIPGTKFNESELRVDFPNGSRIFLAGADNPDSLRGLALDMVVFDEYAQMNPRAWSEVIRPALADRKGRAIFIGTPSGKNRFYHLFEAAGGQDDWYSVLLTADDTGALDPEELQAAKRTMGEDEFNQEFYCSWTAAVRGAYYAGELNEARMQGRVTRVPWEPGGDVHTFFDLGISDATSIWFAQTTAGEIRVIEYMEFTDTSLIEIIKELRTKPYIYGQHYGPHDLAVRELSSGKTRREIAYDLGFDFNVAPKLSVADGIELGRLLIRRVWFDAENCHAGLEALEQYRKIWDDKRQVYLKQPIHDWTSHAADAWRYFAVCYEQLLRPQKVAPPKQIRALR